MKMLKCRPQLVKRPEEKRGEAFPEVGRVREKRLQKGKESKEKKRKEQRSKM